MTNEEPSITSLTFQSFRMLHSQSNYFSFFREDFDMHLDDECAAIEVDIISKVALLYYLNRLFFYCLGSLFHQKMRKTLN